MRQPESLIGQSIGGFTVEERLARGGMATVYRALQPSMHRAVALKIIHLADNSGEDRDFRRRFEQEANLIASLEHIHILPVIDYGIDQDVAFIAMRLLRGGTLADQLTQGPLPLARAVEVFTQIARGLAHAHRRGVIHRDLKPSNIMFDEAGNAYLTDFGLAKLVEGSADFTQEGGIVGTPAYMSPEQLRGDALTPRSDLYSMGVVLYHMLTGKPPFESSDPNRVMIVYGHLEMPPPLPRSLNPALPETVERVILKALEKQPPDRFASAEEMIESLRMALDLPVSADATPPVTVREAPPTPPTVPARPLPRRRLSRLALAAAVPVALAGVLLLLAPRLAGPIPAPVMTVVAGAVGEAIDYANPNPGEVARAVAQVGDGFIGIIACTQSSEYHITQTREIRDLAASYGLRVRVYDSAEDRYLQITQIEQARLDGARALLICPLDVNTLDSALRSAQAAGIPMVFLAGNIPSYGGVLLSGNDYEMGLKAGRAGGELANALLAGEARVLVLDFPEMELIVERANGMVSGLLEIAPDSAIVDHRRGGTRPFGHEAVRSALEEGLDFNFILSINDAGTLGAIEALEEAGVPTDDVVIVSVDAEAVVQEYIRDSHYVRASLAVSRAAFSQAAVCALVHLLAGDTLPETLTVPPGEMIISPAPAGTIEQS